jgi:hypothetical protein
MIAAKRYMLALTMLSWAANLSAQDLTGTWEGDMGTYQFLQLNMVQKGDKICGYTWDHIKYDQQSFCKAYFEARFDKEKRKLLIYGTSFFANSGSHTLMELELSHKFVNDEEVLFYTPTTFEKLIARLNGEAVETAVYLKKVADKPYSLLPGIVDCLNEKKKTLDSATLFQVPLFPGDTVVASKKPADTVLAVLTPAKITKDSAAIPTQVEQRKNIEQSHIEVNVKSINLKVYDNAIMDGDTISILYNGRLLLSHQLLSEKAIEINLELDEGQTRHEIILFAENLGSIPPNTALVVITAGEKRYELFASASLQENAVLVFNYRPK